MTDFEQPDLFTIVEPDTEPGADIKQRFEAFHRSNPAIYAMLVRFARQIPAGRKIGISLLFERLRWEATTQTTSTDFKLNNTFRAWYVRLIMHNNPDLADLFELRKSAADQWIGRAA